MATYDSADLLLRFQEQALRPAADEITSASIYRWLTRAQNKVVGDIAARCPWTLYGAPAALSTADGGKTFTFGTDPNGYPVVVFGKAKIFPNLNAVPDYPWQEGYDYLNEGSLIRIPNNRSYPGGLFYRGITQPKDIAAGGSNEPALLPEASRELIVIEAVRDFASQGGRLPSLATAKASEYGLELARWLLVWRTQFSSGGALTAYGMPGALSTLSGTLAGISVSP